VEIQSCQEAGEGETKVGGTSCKESKKKNVFSGLTDNRIRGERVRKGQSGRTENVKNEPGASQKGSVGDLVDGSSDRGGIRQLGEKRRRRGGGGEPWFRHQRIWWGARNMTRDHCNSSTAAWKESLIYTLSRGRKKVLKGFMGPAFSSGRPHRQKNLTIGKSSGKGRK